MSSKSVSVFDVIPEEYNLPHQELYIKLDILKKHPVFVAFYDLHHHIAKRENDEKEGIYSSIVHNIVSLFYAPPQEYYLPLPYLRAKLEILKKHPVFVAFTNLQQHIVKKQTGEWDCERKEEQKRLSEYRKNNPSIGWLLKNLGEFIELNSKIAKLETEQYEYSEEARKLKEMGTFSEQKPSSETRDQIESLYQKLLLLPEKLEEKKSSETKTESDS